MNSQTEQKAATLPVYILAIVTSMGAFMFGYDLAFIGTSIELTAFEQDFALHDATASVKDAFAANIVSLLQAGCFFGSLAAAPAGDRFGRRCALALGTLAFTAGSIMQAASMGNTSVMFIGRFIGGLGVGSASMLIPLYTAECSPPSIRGRLVGIYEIGVQVGTCIGFWINYAVERTLPSTSSQWITPFAVQLIPAGLLLLGLVFLPDSPRWMAKARGREGAIATLSRLRGLPAAHKAVQDEVRDIFHQLEVEEESTHGHRKLAGLRELMQPGIRNRLALGVAIMVFFQMAGSNAINYYSPRIFRSIGLTGTSTTLVSTGIYGIVRPSQCGSSAPSSNSTPPPPPPSVPAPTQPQSSSSSSPSPSASAGPASPGSSAPRSTPCVYEEYAWPSAWQRTGYSIS
ncbi:hypothetical protein MW887_004532 [Aspergillus wentii]|nr:hypothetical protein MW887_004532 [Aspergillus wentii]